MRGYLQLLTIRIPSNVKEWIIEAASSKMDIGHFDGHDSLLCRQNVEVVEYLPEQISCTSKSGFCSPGPNLINYG